jgi:hypothetical protein
MTDVISHKMVIAEMAASAHLTKIATRRPNGMSMSVMVTRSTAASSGCVVVPISHRCAGCDRSPE